MSCTMALSKSPVFSPSSSLFRNKGSVVVPPPAEAISSTVTHLKSTLSPSSSSPSSPRSPFRLRLQKPPIGLTSSSGSGSSVAAASVLKRKRPARLDIPVATLGFGGPATLAVEEVEMEREGVGYSVFCKRGKREAMEDRFAADVDFQGNSKLAFFGIFDGHGGSEAAVFAANNLGKNISEEVVGRDEEEIENAVKSGYLTTDAEYLKEDNPGGSCCVTALIQKGNLIISNVGDCRAVMSDEGVAEALTSDHRPSRDDEKDRIESLGGYVDLIRGVWRVQGSLAVSRGIGDQHLKQWIIAEPETKIVRIKPGYEFLIMASDGLWDKVGNQEAVDIARALLVGVDEPQPLSACKRLVDLSASRGSLDDITVMLIQLGQLI
uniref:protein-serine/threonine phosphatase n=1 Tax=Rhizophora mucronata TaxID=61149 RepID=A0A2P2IKL0_RHIMU